MATYLRVNKTKLYETLNVPLFADVATIKSSYKRLALQYHPDKHVGSGTSERESAAARFQDISAAFEVLSDPEKRTAYDQHGMPGVDAINKGEVGTAAGRERAEAPFPDEAHQKRQRARASETYRTAFGHAPVADAPRVHNMAAQRGGGSFDELQRQRLDDIFEGLGLGGAADEPFSSSAIAPRISISRGYGAYSGTGWSH